MKYTFANLIDCRTKEPLIVKSSVKPSEEVQAKDRASAQRLRSALTTS